MKIKILIMCAVLGLGFGCKKEADQVDRYKVFSASWEDQAGRSVATVKSLVKVDSVTGRAWYWSSVIVPTNVPSEGWVELRNWPNFPE